MASTVEPTLDAPTEPSRDLVVGSSVREWLDAVDQFRVFLLKASRAIVTEFGRIACREYGGLEYDVFGQKMINVQPPQPVWYGRLVMWPDGFEHRQFELTRFSVEHRIRKSRHEAVYRMGVSK